MRAPVGSGLCSSPCPGPLSDWDSPPGGRLVGQSSSRGGPVRCWQSFRRRTVARRNHEGRWVCATTGTGTCGWEL